jgi:hypothetical protein
MYDLAFNLLLSVAGLVLAGINLWNYKKVKRLIIENELLKLKLKNYEQPRT